MQKRNFLAGSIFTGLALSMVGCEGEPKPEPKSEAPVALPGPAATPGPIDPSPTPSLPAVGNNPKPAGVEAKKEEPKSEEKK